MLESHGDELSLVDSPSIRNQRVVDGCGFGHCAAVGVEGLHVLVNSRKFVTQLR